MFHFYKQQNCKIPIVKRASLNIVDRKVTNDYQRPRGNLSSVVINDSRTYKPPSPRRKIRPEDINIRPRVLKPSAKGRLTNEERVQYSKEIQDAADKYALIGDKVITKLFQAEVNDPADVEYINRRSKLISTGLSKQEADNILISTFRPQRKTKKAVDLSRMDVLIPEAISIIKQILGSGMVEVRDIAQSIDILNDSLLNNNIQNDDIINVLNLLASNPELRVDRGLQPSVYDPVAILSNVVVGNDLEEVSDNNRSKPVSKELASIISAKGRTQFIADYIKKIQAEILANRERLKEAEEAETNILMNMDDILNRDYVPSTTIPQGSSEPPVEEEEKKEEEEEQFELTDYDDDEGEEEPVEFTETAEAIFKGEVIDILENPSNIEGDLERVLENPLFSEFNSPKFKELINDAVNAVNISDDLKVKYKKELMAVVNEKFRVPEFKPVTELFREEVKKELNEAGKTANYAPIREKYKDRITEENMDTIINFEINQIYKTPKKKKKPEDVEVPPTPTPTPEEELPQELPQTNEALIKQIENLPDTIIINDLKQIIARFNAMVESSGARFRFEGYSKIKAVDKQKHIDNLKRKLETWQNEKGKIQRPFLVLKDTLEPIKECFIQQFAQLKRSTKESNISIVNKYVFDESLTIAKLLQNIDTLRMSLSWPNTQTGLSDYAYSKTLRCIIGKIIDSLKNAGSLQKNEASKITEKKENIWVNKGTTQKEKIVEFKRLIENEFQSKAPIIKSDQPAARPNIPSPSPGTPANPATIETIAPSKTGQGKKRGRPKKERKEKQNRKPSEWIVFVKSVAKSQGLKYGDALKVASMMKK